MNDKFTVAKMEVVQWTTDRLREEFASGLRVTVDHLVRMAAILHELERRGVGVTGVPSRILSLLRRIASGKLLPETVVQFAGTPSVLAVVGRLPPERQRKMIEDDDERKDYVYGCRNRKAEDEEAGPFVGAAALATPKDLADTIAEMIRRNPQPAMVWELLAAHPTVRKLTGEQPKKMVG